MLHQVHLARHSVDGVTQEFESASKSSNDGGQSRPLQGCIHLFVAMVVDSSGMDPLRNSKGFRNFAMCGVGCTSL